MESCIPEEPKTHLQVYQTQNNPRCLLQVATHLQSIYSSKYIRRRTNSSRNKAGIQDAGRWKMGKDDTESSIPEEQKLVCKYTRRRTIQVRSIRSSADLQGEIKRSSRRWPQQKKIAGEKNTRTTLAKLLSLQSHRRSDSFQVKHNKLEQKQSMHAQDAELVVFFKNQNIICMRMTLHNPSAYSSQERKPHLQDQDSGPRGEVGRRD